MNTFVFEFWQTNQKKGLNLSLPALRSTQFKVHAFCWRFNGLENHCWFKFFISGFDPTLSNCNFVRILEYNDSTYYNCNFVRTISSLVHIQVRHKNKWLLTVAPVCSFVHSFQFSNKYYGHKHEVLKQLSKIAFF